MILTLSARGRSICLNCSSSKEHSYGLDLVLGSAAVVPSISEFSDIWALLFTLFGWEFRVYRFTVGVKSIDIPK
jgi:hypothetical protein